MESLNFNIQKSTEPRILNQKFSFTRYAKLVLFSYFQMNLFINFGASNLFQHLSNERALPLKV